MERKEENWDDIMTSLSLSFSLSLSLSSFILVPICGLDSRKGHSRSFTLNEINVVRSGRLIWSVHASIEGRIDLPFVRDEYDVKENDIELIVRQQQQFKKALWLSVTANDFDR